MKNIRKAAWIEPGKVERQEKWEYPLDAVREATTNAIVHRDYQTTSKTQVRIFDDRIEIWNPGRLPQGWDVDTLKQEHESKPFNPLLAKIFFLGGYIEEWGRGTVDIVEKKNKNIFFFSTTSKSQNNKFCNLLYDRRYTRPWTSRTRI